MRFTKKSDKLGYCLRHSSIKTWQCWDKLGQIEDLMEKYEIDSVEALEKIISDFDSCCQDLINILGLVTALQSYIDSKGLTKESKPYVKKYMESLKKRRT